MEIKGLPGAVRRDPRIRITGRPCCICRSNCPLALVFRVTGKVKIEAAICPACMARAAAPLARGEDSYIELHSDPYEVPLIVTPH